MKVILVLGILVLFSSSVISQDGKLPEILVPSQYAQAEAKRFGADVFKILPRFLLTEEMASHKDDDYPLGVRESGAFYSFTTKSHSYNKVPQIGLEGVNLQTGFAGFNYGLMKDLGQVSVENVNVDQPDVTFLATYSPRNLIPEIRAEQSKRGAYKWNDYVYRANLPALEGHTYVLRAIAYDQADVLVAFHIVQKLEDGSLEIVWKELKSFPIPRPWYSTDEEMAEKLHRILALERFAGIHGEVKDNVITIRGMTSQGTLNDLCIHMHSLRPIKVNYEVTVAK